MGDLLFQLMVGKPRRWRRDVRFIPMEDRLTADLAVPALKSTYLGVAVNLFPGWLVARTPVARYRGCATLVKIVGAIYRKMPHYSLSRLVRHQTPWYEYEAQYRDALKLWAALPPNAELNSFCTTKRNPLDRPHATRCSFHPWCTLDWDMSFEVGSSLTALIG